jgi:hypothetical protein
MNFSRLYEKYNTISGYAYDYGENMQRLSEEHFIKKKLQFVQWVTETG